MLKEVWLLRNSSTKFYKKYFKIDMNKLLVVIGPTAVGKSDLAILLAKKYNGEIISADSRQVYRKLDLGTGKVEMDKNSKSEGIIHHMIDIVDVSEQYSIAEFQKETNKKIKEI
jgi:tRNA dimethylallyltransferase